jgi:hypothetical protein
MSVYRSPRHLSTNLEADYHQDSAQRVFGLIADLELAVVPFGKITLKQPIFWIVDISRKANLCYLIDAERM